MPHMCGIIRGASIACLSKQGAQGPVILCRADAPACCAAAASAAGAAGNACAQARHPAACTAAERSASPGKLMHCFHQTHVWLLPHSIHDMLWRQR